MCVGKKVMNLDTEERNISDYWTFKYLGYSYIRTVGV